MSGGFLSRPTVAVVFFVAMLLFLEDEVHVAKHSSCVVTFDRGCYLAQLHCEFFHGQDVWRIADSGEIVPIEGGLICNVICTLVLVLAIVGHLIYTLFIVLIRV